MCHKPTVLMVVTVAKGGNCSPFGPHRELTHFGANEHNHNSRRWVCTGQFETLSSLHFYKRQTHFQIISKQEIRTQPETTYELPAFSAFSASARALSLSCVYQTTPERVRAIPNTLAGSNGRPKTKKSTANKNAVFPLPTTL